MEGYLTNIPNGGGQTAQSLYSILMRGIFGIHNNPRVELTVADYNYFESVVSALTEPHDSREFTRLYYPEASPRNPPSHNPSPYQIIYDKLHDFLARHLDNVAENILSHDWALDAYLEEWDLFNNAATRVDYVLKQVNIIWIEGHISGGIRELFYIYTLHCVQWQKHVWSRVCYRVVDDVQRALWENDEYATEIRRYMERFQWQHVGENGAEMDERTRIYQSLEALFSFRIRAHNKRVDNYIHQMNRLRIVNRGLRNRR